MFTHALKCSLLLAIVSLMSGCIGLSPTPDFARTGDTVQINLGGIKRNASSQVIKTSDLTVTLTDANSQAHFPQVVGVFRVFPDHTSEYAVSSQDPNNGNYGDLVPHDGALWVAVRLVDSNGVNLTNLALGTATISIASTKLTQTFKSVDGNYGNFPLEIVAGEYIQPNPWFSDLRQSQYMAYQTQEYLTVRPSIPPATTVGGAQIEIVLEATYPYGITDQYLRLVPLNHDPNVSLIQKSTLNQDGTRTITAMLTNPNGFVPGPIGAVGESSELDLQLGIVSTGGFIAAIADADLGTYFTMTTNSFYCDLDGNVIPGVAPVLLNEFCATGPCPL